MPEKMTQKELEQLMGRLFSIDPSDTDFFRRYFSELVKTDCGTDLLRKLEKNSSKNKIVLKRFSQKRGAGGYCHTSPEKEEIGIYSDSNPLFLFFIKMVQPNPDVNLFHELTHQDQKNNKTMCSDLQNKPDVFFTYMACETDAKVSAFFYMRELAINGNWKDKLSYLFLNNDSSFVENMEYKLRKKRPDLSDEQVTKELKKSLFKRIIATKYSFIWAKYKKMAMEVANHSERPEISKISICDAMAYYMKKYGFESEDIFELRKACLAASGQKFEIREPAVQKSQRKISNRQILSRSSARPHAPQTKPKQNSVQICKDPSDKSINRSILSRRDPSISGH